MGAHDFRPTRAPRRSPSSQQADLRHTCENLLALLKWHACPAPSSPQGANHSSPAAIGHTHVSCPPLAVVVRCRLWNAHTSLPSCLCTARAGASRGIGDRGPSDQSRLDHPARIRDDNRTTTTPGTARPAAARPPRDQADARRARTAQVDALPVADVHLQEEVGPLRPGLLRHLHHLRRAHSRPPPPTAPSAAGRGARGARGERRRAAAPRRAPSTRPAGS